MNVTRGLLASAILTIASGCAERRFPGTEIPDNKDTRALIGVLQSYQSAVNAKDAEAVLNLISPNFQDLAGTTATDDDLDHETLKRVLPDRFAKMEDVRLLVEPRNISVDENRGFVTYYYTINYKLPKLTNDPLMESELKQMVFAREGKEWKILSGI